VSRLLVGVLLLGLCLLPAPDPIDTAATTPGPSAAAPGNSGEYVVLYAADSAPEAARAAIAAAGGTIVRENTAIGVATVRTTRADGFFLRILRRAPAIAGATVSVPLGRVSARATVAREIAPGTPPTAQPNNGEPSAGDDPLSPLQWDMRAIGATAEGAHAIQGGDNRVLVGIIDTGVDGNHPDIAPNFDTARSRNFVTDSVELDGACTYASCVDPADEDDNGHGTHVAGTIAAARNGLGIVGVAPNVTIVNLRAGQDSGKFLLQPTVDALTYAGDIGVNVVNMSYYIDPWLYNCPANAADSAEAQEAQRTTIAATQRALDYARSRGVVLVAAAGNEHSDLDDVTVDTVSPNFPTGAAYRRTVDDSCLSMPAEGRGVIAVAATGPSGRKSFYSNYGLAHADIAAPGGDSLEYYGTAQYQPIKNRILAPYPRKLLLASGEIDEQGQVTARGTAVVRDCHGEICAYYRYLEGTSMASPHVAGVAALIVSEYGAPGQQHPSGLALNPATVEQILYRTADPHACPAARPYTYPGISGSATAAYAALCAGDTAHNSFYGTGIVNAMRAVGR
jgi:subtilisin family serine protease